MEACTVTALDAITAFAVPNPNCPSQSRRFFQVWLLFGLPRQADHSAYFGLANFTLANPFSRRRKQPRDLLKDSQCPFSVQSTCCDGSKLGNATL